MTNVSPIPCPHHSEPGTFVARGWRGITSPGRHGSPFLSETSPSQLLRREQFLSHQLLAELDAERIVDPQQLDGHSADRRPAHQVRPLHRKCRDHLCRRGLNRGVSLRVAAARLLMSEPLNELQ